MTEQNVKLLPHTHLRVVFDRLTDQKVFDIVTNYEKDMPNLCSADDWRDMFIILGVKYINEKARQREQRQ